MRDNQLHPGHALKLTALACTLLPKELRQCLAAGFVPQFCGSGIRAKADRRSALRRGAP
jgi:hypothetical protein